MYTQCKIIKGNIQDVVWIPKKFAKKGKYIRIKDDNGWLVSEVYQDLNEEEVLINRDAYRDMPDVSDI